MGLPSVVGTGTACIEAAICFVCGGPYPGQVFATTIIVNDTNDNLEVACKMCLADPDIYPDHIIRKTAEHNCEIPVDAWEDQVRGLIRESRKPQE